MRALPTSIGLCSSLQTLDVHSCEALTSLPDSLGELTGLHTLDVSACKRLTLLPERLGELRSLSTVNVQWCDRLTIPESMRRSHTLLRLLEVASPARPDETFNLHDSPSTELAGLDAELLCADDLDKISVPSTSTISINGRQSPFGKPSPSTSPYTRSSPFGRRKSGSASPPKSPSSTDPLERRLSERRLSEDRGHSASAAVPCQQGADSGVETGTRSRCLRCSVC